ncbi:MAG: MarR family winged helix-turn-helix transcriptional regulator, partial [Rhizobiaceae bacterium]|nr:MarR family winged helix-turn-helix transcriptional regulator [Rhizobiaceae bacterium]
VYLALASLYAIRTPAWQAPDEPAHYNYIRQIAGPADRRQRRLYPTLAGRELALALSQPQSLRISRALEGFTPEMRETVKRFLEGMSQTPAAGEPQTSGDE